MILQFASAELLGLLMTADALSRRDTPTARRTPLLQAPETTSSASSVDGMDSLTKKAPWYV